MDKLKSTQELKELRKSIIADKSPDIPTIVISAGTCGQASGANDLIRITKRTILDNKLVDKVKLRVTGCHGFCEMEPSVLIEPARTFYPQIKNGDMSRIVKAVANNETIEDLLYFDKVSGKKIKTQDDLPFYKTQIRSILSLNEKIDPIRIYNYIEIGGYSSMAKAFKKDKPSWVINEVKESKIRGRGGAGFPTGIKWELLAKQSGKKGKYLVCNADEGDPGAYMDRSVIEGNPHSIIEGMIIGAYATGATEGIVYIRDEYPLAIKHLIIALRQAHDIGFLGKNILGTGFSFDIKIIRGAGAFVCGEETALMKSIEGKMGEPKQRPPFPIEKGIYAKPTAINNVETWANIPYIILKGGAEYAKVGTENSTGTKIFSLVGKIKNTGLVEVPMGITIKEIVYDIGGGASGESKVKAVQTGGPSGGCIPVHEFDMPIDYDSLAKAGSIMGSGGMIVMDERTCMVDVAKFYMRFLKEESCGKCFTCRKGTQRMYELLDDISNGNGTMEKLSLLQELAIVVKDTTMCGLGQTASNPVLSTLKYFREEYIDHIINKRCKAGVCKDLVGAPCQATCPIGTEAWKYIAHIANGEYEEAYLTIREANPFPSVCARVCNHPCEFMCRAGDYTGQPVAIRALKRFITDRIDPSIYKPKRNGKNNYKYKIAIIGSGPAGMTAAHKLSLLGYKATVFEKDSEPGGMLISGIPAYRLPRDVIRKEIDNLIDDNIELVCNTALGRDITIDYLLDNGYKSVFLAMGAHKSKLLNIDGEELEGVFPAIQFLKAFNLEGKILAKGRVGIIGGGDSAIDAARVSLRQKDVESVTVLYRRTRQEMPALSHEIDAAIDEGVKLETLMTPVSIKSDKGKIAGAEFIKNELGDVDSSGRRRPVPIPGTEEVYPCDTLIITIGDTPDVGYITYMGIDTNKWGSLVINENTLETNRKGVFAGGDVVTGPNTVVDAIAAGKKAAIMIDRYIHGKDLNQPLERQFPKEYVPPVEIEDDGEENIQRIELPVIPVKQRITSLEEVELTLLEEQARKESLRCLRCDLDFTYKENKNEREIEIQVLQEEGEVTQ
ncbi:NADH-ubiquinone oxidoreductase-F iron-sulfur binding region domain-containing protein [Bacteroidota bacterium]